MAMDYVGSLGFEEGVAMPEAFPIVSKDLHIFLGFCAGRFDVSSSLLIAYPKEEIQFVVDRSYLVPAWFTDGKALARPFVTDVYRNIRRLLASALEERVLAPFGFGHSSCHLSV